MNQSVPQRAEASGKRRATSGVRDGHRSRSAVADVPIGGKYRRNRKPALSSSTHPVARHSPIYDIEGPKVRLGVLWALVLGLALVSGPTSLAVVYAAVAAVAAMQTAEAWILFSSSNPNRYVAAAGGAALVVGARLGVASMGLAALSVAVVALIAAAATRPSNGMARSPGELLADSGVTLQCALFCGLAAASPVLAGRIELGAAVVLVVLVCAYEIGDFLVGSGSSNNFEGPLAGMVTVSVITFSLTVFDQLMGIPPFDGLSLVFYGVAVGVLAPMGPICASIMLPRSDARAPALRRLDTLIVAGPVWTVALWQHVGF